MMTTIELRDEIEACLMRGVETFFDPSSHAYDTAKDLCRERANNLAQIYAGRVLTEDEALTQRVLSVPSHKFLTCGNDNKLDSHGGGDAP